MNAPAPRSAYIHIPFCHRRCFYCDFPVVPLGDRADGATGPGSSSIRRYLGQLLHEIAISPSGPALSTVYVGGGTPSLLSPDQVAALLSALHNRYGLADGAEITLELDPAGFDQHRLNALLALGVNRVSFGAQSLDDAVLDGLGRRHRRHHVLEAASWLERARRAGDLRSWSLDLLQGLPEQNGRTWLEQLEQALALEPPHLSVYDLIIEPGTVFERWLEQGRLQLPEEETAADLLETTAARLAAAGYGRYEISNWAWPGHASRHNRVYWSGADWWAFGLGATSALGGQRLARPRTREAYGRWLASGAAAEQRAGDGLPLDEQLMVGLRRREGVSMRQLSRQHGLTPAHLTGLRARLADHERRGLLVVEGDRWRLSDPVGLALSNGVLREIVAWCLPD
jgi:oxygen-independent coproporphyrinogen-3 oxidase